jgi:putative ABC transport system permease protein
MAGLRWRQVAAERFRTGILSSFALTATFLVLVGIFGLVAYSVAQRTREIGVRIAIGATHADILWMVMSHGMLPTALGVILGLIGAIGLSRFVASFLYQLTPTDPMTYAITAASLLVASLAASLIPARRATRLDPMVALRCE